MIGFPCFRSSRNFARIAAVVAICAGVSACQTAGEGGLVASHDKVELAPAAAGAIAGDVVTRLAEVVGPGTGTIILKSDGSPFGDALETALKGWGYAVAAPDQKVDNGKAIPLAYVVDSFEGKVLVRLSTSTADLGRAYTVTPTGASPSSPLSVMRRG